jgi:hypothetical protein
LRWSFSEETAMQLLRPLMLASALALLAPAGAALAQRPAPPTFESLDTNHDGVLSKDEVNAWFASRREAARRGGEGRGPGGGGFGGGGPGGGGGFGGHRGGFGNNGSGGEPQGASDGGRRQRPSPDQIFASWDKDGNGTISKDEFDSRPRFGRRGGRPPPASGNAQEPPQN